MTYELGKNKHVFIDWDFVEPGYGLRWGGGGPDRFEMPYGIKLVVHPPRIDWNPLVEPDQPWEQDIEVHHSIFEDEGRFRLYYRIWDIYGDHLSTESADMFRLAYAESEDGVNWVKPIVGTYKFDGSFENNIINLGMPAGSPVVFKDPSAPEPERYKLVFRGREGGLDTFEGNHHIWGATSRDGLDWEVINKPLLSGYHSDTHNIVTYSKTKDKYVGYFRGWDPPPIGGRRTIAYAETEDFANWPEPQPIIGPDVYDEPDTDFYTNSYTPWPGANAHLLFPAVFERRLDVTELHMFTSRDGLKWQRISRKPIIPKGSPGSQMEAGVYAGAGIISVNSGEWSIPIAPQSTTHNQCQFKEGLKDIPHHGFICLATWREDGFTSIETETEGSFCTLPFILRGGELVLGTWSNYGGSVTVELVEVSEGRRNGNLPPVSGRSFRDCDVISGDNIHQTVTWNGQSDISIFEGKEVCLRFKLVRSNLYSLQVK